MQEQVVSQTIHPQDARRRIIYFCESAASGYRRNTSRHVGPGCGWRQIHTPSFDTPKQLRRNLLHDFRSVRIFPPVAFDVRGGRPCVFLAEQHTSILRKASGSVEFGTGGRGTLHTICVWVRSAIRYLPFGVSLPGSAAVPVRSWLIEPTTYNTFRATEFSPAGIVNAAK